MDKKVLSLGLTHLPNETHLQFMRSVSTLLSRTEYTQLRLALGTVYDSFVQAFVAEDLANEKIRKSAYTEQIAKLDAFRDALYYTLGVALAAYEKSDNADEANAAKQLKIIYDNYGSVANSTMLQESGVITSMLQDMHAATELLDILSLRPLTDRLNDVNNTLNDLMAERNVETADKDAVGTVPAARLNSDNAYHRLTATLEVMGFTAVPALQTSINNFIALLNSTIAQFRRVIKVKKPTSGSSDDGGDDGDDGEIVEEVIVVKE
jgi:hypothetical protein